VTLRARQTSTRFNRTASTILAAGRMTYETISREDSYFIVQRYPR
jgi:hypothetical protein